MIIVNKLSSTLIFFDGMHVQDRATMAMGTELQPWGGTGRAEAAGGCCLRRDTDARRHGPTAAGLGPSGCHGWPALLPARAQHRGMREGARQDVGKGSCGAAGAARGARPRRSTRWPETTTMKKSVYGRARRKRERRVRKR